MKLAIIIFEKTSFKDTVKSLADFLGLKFCDVDEMIEYDLVDKQKMIKLCGKEYYNQKEKSVLKRLADFDDVLLFVTTELFLSNENYQFIDMPRYYLSTSDINMLANIADAEKILELKNKLAIKEITDSLMKPLSNMVDINTIDKDEIYYKIFNKKV